MHYKYITIITDCTDDNVKGRLGTRIASLFGVPPTYVGVGGPLQLNNDADRAEYEASGCLIDVLDAGSDAPGAVLVNVANRHGKGKKWPNGTPFGYFYVNETLIVTTIDGLTLSLIKKLHLTESINVLDIPTVTETLVQQGVIVPNLAHHITHTQFRSFEFQPRVTRWLHDGIHLPVTTFPFTDVADIPPAVWFVDNFGNTKTTLLPKDIHFAPGKIIQTKYGTATCYERLKDVPDGETAFIIGSSGYGDDRFLEFVIQGKSAASVYGLTPGSELLV